VLDQFFTAIHLDAAHFLAGVLTVFYAGNRFATPRTLAPKQLWNFADYRSARERPTLFLI
jgi:hypothetical protein